MTDPIFKFDAAPASHRPRMTRSTTTSLLRFKLIERGACVLADRGVLRFRIEEALKRARFEEFALRTRDGNEGTDRAGVA